VTHAEVSHLLDRLRKMPLKARRGVPGLSPDRADIIIAGLTIVDRIMRQFQVNLLQVHNRGVRDGLILTMIDQNLGAPSQDPHDRDAAVERFAATSSGELAHGRQVARLAGRIFAQLAATFGMNAGDQSLLETAARLQDVGYLINYEKHHKHSYHLILNSGLPGFQPRELELIANVARYHRGAKPKRKHDNFRQLSAEDQQRVRQLAAILRLAGGLDRSHSGQVRDVLVEREGDGRLTIEVVAPENPDVDIWSARRRGKMFAKVFKTPLSIRWQGQNQAAADTDTSGATAQAG
jgi:exopolyphosphatase/guanosine-5'-triphosphate,3'-diphosphate pyrophosphatase